MSDSIKKYTNDEDGFILFIKEFCDIPLSIYQERILRAMYVNKDNCLYINMKPRQKLYTRNSIIL